MKVINEAYDTMPMKYLGTVISVDDVNASRKFCEDIFGLELYQDYGRCIGFTCGLSLMQEFGRPAGVPEEKVLKRSDNIELYFEEEHFDAFLKRLEDYPGIQYLHSAKEQPWGQRAIRFYDPNGHMIEVGEDMRAVIDRFLSSGMTKEETAKRIGTSLEDMEKLLND